MEVTQKMQQLLYSHHGESRNKVMKEVFDNFSWMCETGEEEMDKVNLLSKSGFKRLYRCSLVFIRSLLKWCVEEDGTINRDFVDILTDVETHMADTVRFILQHVENGAASFDGKDFGNIDQLLPRMAKACLHVLAAESSPPNFSITIIPLEMYGNCIQWGCEECHGSACREASRSQIVKVQALTDFVLRRTDKIYSGNGKELLICLESLYDKVACHVVLGCWETYYDMYLSAPASNMDTLFDAWIQKVPALPLDASPMTIWTNEILKTSIDHVETSLKNLQTCQDIYLTLVVKDQLKMLSSGLRILENLHINILSQLYADEGLGPVDVRVEVQALTRRVELVCILYFITQTKETNLVVAAEPENESPGIQNLLASIIADRIMRLTSCMPVPLTHEFLIEFMERVQQFMKQILEDDSIIPANPVNDQLEMLRLDLGFYRSVHVDYPLEYCAEPGEVQTVTSNLESFIHIFITQTKNSKHVYAAAAKVIHGLQNLLVAVLKMCILQLTSCSTLSLTDKLLIQFMECVQRFLSRMSKDDSIAPSGSLRVQLEFLHNELSNLLHFHISYLPIAVRMEVQTVVMNAASFVNSTLISQAKHVAAEIVLGVRNLLASILTAWVVQLSREYLEPTMGIPLSDLVEKFTNLKVDVVQDIIFLIIVCRLRRVTRLTDQLCFFNFLLDKMKGSGHGESDLEECQKAHEALLVFRDFLQSMTNYSITYSHDICERVTNVAYEAEYLMYSLDDGSYSASCRNRWIYHFAQHVELTKPSALNTLEKKENDGEISTGSMGDQNQVLSKVLIPTIDLVVGFEDELQHVKQKLVASHRVRQLDVISIIGMPGLGKTTLARKVYEDRQIAGHFEIRAWCRCIVTEEYNKKELLLTILGCIIEVTDMIQKMSEVNLSTLLHKQLMGRRYLVVLDDVWGIDAFEFLTVFFPDNKNGSRILLTSRNRVIGLKAKHHSDILELRLLTNEESWVLLSKKVYLNDECPLELCQVGKRIAESCRGLPLAVVVVAGLLAKSSKTREFWEQVAENLGSYISHDSQAQKMAVLELSYKYLPNHLKPLFLYTGVFPEDREVSVEKLIWLWIAEGFVKDNLIGSLEHQAESYLLDLIDRSFLMVVARRSDGRVKTCIVHDLLRDMSLHKAKEEYVLQQINVSDDLPDPVSYQRRLSILLHRRKEVTPTHLISDGAPTRPFIAYEDLSTLSLTPPLYSLLFFNQNRSLPFWKEAVASVLLDMKFLRILHFESTSIDANLCGDVMMLVHLRYISIRAVWTSIPSSVSKLSNLETLIIKGLRGEIGVPDAIWQLVRLRHLHVNDRAKFCYPSSKSSILELGNTFNTRNSPWR